MQSRETPIDTSHSATVDCVRQMVESAGSYRKAARRLGVSHAAVWNLAHGRTRDVSRRTENKVRAALGLAPAPARVEVDACPDCGNVHTGRCHGRAVAVRPVRQARPVTRWADASTSVLRAAIRNRVEV